MADLKGVKRLGMPRKFINIIHSYIGCISLIYQYIYICMMSYFKGAAWCLFWHIHMHGRFKLVHMYSPEDKNFKVKIFVV